MRAMTLSPSNHFHPKSQTNNSPRKQSPNGINLNTMHPKPNFNQSNPITTKNIAPLTSFALNSSKTQNFNSANPPLVVVGSANADIYVEIDRLPREGETISAKTGQTLAGGKGANQAACGSKLAYPTYFVGQVREDAHGKLISEALEKGGVNLDHLNTVASVPTGHAVVILQSDGQNSIIIVGGANMSCWPETLSDLDLEVVRNAGIVLLQREIPDSVNIQVAKAARNAGVPVILDAGGIDAALPGDLLSYVDILSPNETELGRLTGMPTDTFEQITVAKCHKMGVKQVLVKLGGQGSALFIEGQEPMRQPIISAPKVIDTTGAGDTFTAAFAVALVEGKSKKEGLKFAAAAASLCVQVKGAISSMPDRKSVLDLLLSLIKTSGERYIARRRPSLLCALITTVKTFDIGDVAST
ncbi:LOW QUALITY PROTEIN: Carbohydrate kinase PfkB [Dillenia turbinata]|uniref:Ribokinase n=1 Tax=Dillenia turbinata TaxID=194707 RepID=A0AAN8WB84_9MAGN